MGESATHAAEMQALHQLALYDVEDFPDEDRPDDPDEEDICTPAQAELDEKRERREYDEWERKRTEYNHYKILPPRMSWDPPVAIGGIILKLAVIVNKRVRSWINGVQQWSLENTQVTLVLYAGEMPNEAVDRFVSEHALEQHPDLIDYKVKLTNAVKNALGYDLIDNPLVRLRYCTYMPCVALPLSLPLKRPPLLQPPQIRTCPCRRPLCRTGQWCSQPCRTAATRSTSSGQNPSPTT